MSLALLVLAGASLYEQSVVRLFAERFTDPRVCYLFARTSTGEILGSRWPDSGRPVAPGSLVKVLTAVAYSEMHGGRFPRVVCHGKASGCWLPRGHGEVGIVEAVARSCNAYFHALAAELRMEDVRAVAQRYDVEAPPANAPAEALVGLGAAWKIAPARLARAFGRLIANPGAAQIVSGMAASAESGTGSAAGFGLVKTGTAPCVHRPGAPGDGFVVALYPAGAPRYTLLIRVHGTTGAHAAELAGRMLRVLRDGR